MVNLKSLQVSLREIGVIGLSTAANISILCVFLFLVHVVFQIDFPCTCEDQWWGCSLFMIVPGIVIGLVTLWADKRFRRIYRFFCESCKYSDNKCCECWECCHCYKGTCRYFGSKLFCFSLKAAFAGLVWVVSLLLDGDWYACCNNSLPSEEKMIPCMSKDKLNVDETVSLSEQKKKSLIWGMGVLGGMVVVIIASTCKCCSSKCFASKKKYFEDFKENILENVEVILAEGLTNLSKKCIEEEIHCSNELKLLLNAEIQNDLAANQTSEDAPVTIRDVSQSNAVENVKKINWETFSKFSFDLIDKIQREKEAEAPGQGTAPPQQTDNRTKNQFQSSTRSNNTSSQSEVREDELQPLLYKKKKLTEFSLHLIQKEKN